MGRHSDAPSWRYSNIKTNATTVVKASGGHLHLITVNTRGVTNTITVYDNTAGSGTEIAIIDGDTGEFTLFFDVEFDVGLTIVTAGGTAPNITVAYR